MKKILYYFIQGLFYIAPIGVTIYVLYQIFIFIDSLFFEIIKPHIPGLGLIITIVAVTILGFVGSRVISQPLMSMLNKFIIKLPVIKDLYVPLKDFFSALIGKEKKFNTPVLVKVNNISNLEKIGFITQTDLTDLGIEGKKVSVYFPHSYAFSGELYIVPSESVKQLNISSAVAMKFILTGGAVKQFNNDIKTEI